MAFILGTENSERLEGNLTENDSIFGSGGEDTIIGSLGNDFINGNQGNDLIFGQGSNFGGDASGNDTVRGGRGNDTVYGGGGDSFIYGDKGDDNIFGQFGNDVLFGGSENDLLEGNRGNDSLDGGEGNDTLYGFRFDDLPIAGSKEIDTLTGGLGIDRFILGFNRLGPNVAYQDGVSGSGLDNYALITDFNLIEGDLIQVIGPRQSITSYVAYIRLAPSPIGLPPGTAIYTRNLNEEDELIAIVQGTPLGEGTFRAQNPPPAGFIYV